MAMSELPLRPEHLWAWPLAGLAMGPLAGLGYSRWLGWSLALKLSLLLALLLAGVGAWRAWRAEFGARQGRLDALFFVLAFIPFMGGIGVAAVDMAGLPELAPWAVLTVAAAVMAPLLGAAWSERNRLLAGAPQGPWWQRHVDEAACRLGSEAYGRQPDGAQRRMPWLALGLALNLPLLVRASVAGDRLLLPLGAVGLTLLLAWIGAAHVGPALGRSWALLQRERRTGRRLVHAQFEAIQDLRRGFWLSRAFMADAQAPATPAGAPAGGRAAKQGRHRP
jgi:hypothetical protein